MLHHYIFKTTFLTFLILLWLYWAYPGAIPDRYFLVPILCFAVGIICSMLSGFFQEHRHSVEILSFKKKKKGKIVATPEQDSIPLFKPFFILATLLAIVYALIFYIGSSSLRWNRLYQFRLISKEKAIHEMILSFQENPRDAKRICQVLNKIDPQWTKAPVTQKIMLRMAQDLNSRNESKKNAILEILKEMGTSAIPVLSQVLATKTNWQDSILLVHTLENMGKEGKEALLSHAIHTNPEIRKNIKRTLDKINPSWRKSFAKEEKLPRLLQNLKNSNKDICLATIELLGEMEKDAEGAIPALLQLIQNSEIFLAQPASIALSKIGSKNANVNASLLLFLQNKKPEVKKLGIQTLANMGPSVLENKEAVDLLAKCAQDQDHNIRILAIQALGHIQAKEKQNIVAQALNEYDASIQQAAIESLGNMPTDDKEIIVLLAKMLNNRSEHIRKASLQSLKKIGPAASPALFILESLIKNLDVSLRVTAIETLASIDLKSPHTIACLKFFLQDYNTDQTLLFTIETIGKIGEDAKNLTPPLCEHLVNRNPKISQATQQTLLKIGKPAIPELIKRLLDGNSKMSALSRGILDKIDPNWFKLEIADEAVPDIIKALNRYGNTTEFSISVMEVLALLGPKAKTAIPSLKAKYLNSWDKRLTSAAEKALNSIDPDWRNATDEKNE